MKKPPTKTATAFDALQEAFASAADEILPMSKIGLSVIVKDAEEQYLATLPLWRQGFWPWLTKREKQKAILWALENSEKANQEHIGALRND